MIMLHKQLIILLLTVLLLLTGISWADLNDSRTQLEKIQQQIEKAQDDLDKKRKTEVQFSRQLVLLQRTLQRLEKRIATLKKEQSQIQVKVNAQKKQIVAGKRQIRRTGKRLEKRLVALYKEGDIGPLKIMFSADTPTELVQQYHYLTRVMEYDRELLGEYRSAVAIHQQQLVDLERLEQQHSALLKKEQQQRKVATDGRHLQSRLLKQVKAEKKRLQQELVRLRQRAKRLQGLISRLQQQPAVASAPGDASLSAGKGKLRWPVNGKVMIGFGTQKDALLGTYYESNGIEIAVAPGVAIHAVADGKVVFSDWFKGYGNLLILSHAGGFHTLYAQAASLDRPLGAQVKAGDALATSGLGGRESIYFEIRHNGSPVDPLRWLQPR